MGCNISGLQDEGHLVQVKFKDGLVTLILISQKLTEVGALSFLPEVAHDWSTLLTVVNQAILKEQEVVENHMTHITSTWPCIRK